MSFQECLDNGAAEGKITPEIKADLQRAYDEALADARRYLPESEAQAKAARETFDKLEYEAVERQRRLRLTEAKVKENTAHLDDYVNLKGEIDRSRGLAAFIAKNEGGAFSSLQAREEVVHGTLHNLMRDVILTFQRNLRGKNPKPALMRDIVTELFGGDSQNPAAKALSEGWRNASEYARRRFNAAGGAIVKREDWGLPTSHDLRAVGAVSQDVWKEFITPLLNPSKMIDDVTGKPLTAARLDEALDDVYQSITTAGWSKREPQMHKSGVSFANKHQHERFLVFKDGKGWMAYQEQFGQANAFDTMMGHLSRMAKDIAAVEVLGPNPRAMLNYLSDYARQNEAKKGPANKKQKSIEGDIRMAETLFKDWAGESNIPADTRLSDWAQTIRSGLTAALLGRAIFSSLTDRGNIAMARSYNKLARKHGLSDVVKMMNPKNLDDQRLALRSGFIAENAGQKSLAQARFVGEVGGREMMGMVTDFVLRTTGLSPWTQANRWAFGMDIQGNFADLTRQSVDAMIPEHQRIFKRHGISAQDWEDVRKVTLPDDPRGQFLTPERVLEIKGLPKARRQFLADRLQEIVYSEMEFGVPTNAYRSDALWKGQTQSGTWLGEGLRSVKMLKSFSTSVVLLHGRRILEIARDGSKMDAAIYMARMVAFTTLPAALGLQLSEISKGKDPRPMDSAEFWGASMLKGGGLGIWGDFLSSENNRFGGGLAETAAGPVVGFGSDVIGLTAGNLIDGAGDLFSGEKLETGFKREFLTNVKRYTPGSTSWYSGLFYERLVIDQLQQLADPEANARFRRKMRNAQRETEQGYYWQPGEVAPRRGPDLANALPEGRE